MTENEKNKKIFVLGPNPAWQVTLFFNDLKLGKVNRATEKKSFSSGKGINFCRAAMQTSVEPVLFHFTGGHTGQLINKGLTEEQIAFHAIDISSESRRCTTCLSNTDIDMTELIEPTGAVNSSECNKLIKCIADNLPSCAGIAFCGTVPPGAENLFRSVAEIAADHQLPLLVDACENVDKFLSYGEIILKVNAEEIKGITGKKSVPVAIRTAFEHFKLHTVAVTDGAECAYLYDGTTLFSYVLPDIGAIVSSLGSGDTCSAIFASKLLEGSEPYLAFAAGLAAASANCLTYRCAEFSQEKAQSILNKINITRDQL